MSLWLHICASVSVVHQFEKLFSFFLLHLLVSPLPIHSHTYRPQSAFIFARFIELIFSGGLLEVRPPRQHTAHLSQFEFMSDLCCTCWWLVEKHRYIPGFATYTWWCAGKADLPLSWLHLLCISNLVRY